MNAHERRECQPPKSEISNLKSPSDRFSPCPTPTPSAKIPPAMKTSHLAILVSTLLLCTAAVCVTIWKSRPLPDRLASNPYASLRRELFALRQSLAKHPRIGSDVGLHLYAVCDHAAYVSDETRELLYAIKAQFDRHERLTPQGEPDFAEFVVFSQAFSGTNGDGLYPRALRSIDRDQFGTARLPK